MTVGLLELENHQFWNLLGELVVLILKPLQLLRSSLAFGFQVDKMAQAPTDRMTPTLSREAVRCFISFWMAVSRLFSSLILFAICVWLSCPAASVELVPLFPTNHWTKHGEILANLCKCCTAFAANQTNKHQTPPFPPAAGSCSQGGSWTAHTHGPPQSMSLGSPNCIFFCPHCEDFIWISSKHHV